MNKNIPIIIFGGGSIGERHIKNLQYLGYNNIYVYRQKNLPFRDVDEKSVEIILDKDQIPNLNCEVAFICTPSSQHMAQTIYCLQNNMHVFVEKPLSHNLENFELLMEIVKEKKLCVHVAYMMRFHPLILKIKGCIEENNYGRLIAFNTHWGSNLTNWHSWESYKDSYAAKKELGGGVALTLSHDIDLANWLVNSPVKSYKSEFSYYDQFEINVESVADFLIRYENNVVGHVHLNFLEQVPRRKYEFIFESGTMEFDYFKSELSINTLTNQELIPLDHFERNSLFVDEVKYFFDLINENNSITTHSLKQITESFLIIKMSTV